MHVYQRTLGLHHRRISGQHGRPATEKWPHFEQVEQVIREEACKAAVIYVID
jgi:hypothetical protein